MSPPNDNTTSSMQDDIAIQVANIIRDETVYQLELERNELVDKLRQKRTVQVTGKEGTPIYAQGQLDGGHFLPNNPSLWGLTLLEGGSTCNLSKLQNVEVRIGGKVMAAFEKYSEFHVFTKPDHLHTTHGAENEELAEGENEEPAEAKDEGPTEAEEDPYETFNICFSPNDILMQVDFGWKRKELLELGLPEDGGVQEVNLDLLRNFLLEQDEDRTCNFHSIGILANVVKGIIPYAMDPAQLRMNKTFKRVYDFLGMHVDNQRRRHLAYEIVFNEPELEDISDEEEEFENIVLAYAEHLHFR